MDARFLTRSGLMMGPGTRPGPVFGTRNSRSECEKNPTPVRCRNVRRAKTVVGHRVVISQWVFRYQLLKGLGNVSKKTGFSSHQPDERSSWREQLPLVNNKDAGGESSRVLVACE